MNKSLKIDIGLEVKCTTRLPARNEIVCCFNKAGTAIRFGFFDGDNWWLESMGKMSIDTVYSWAGFQYPPQFDTQNQPKMIGGI